jgi:acyl-coenzyme A thioesterase PaaI-like protein
MPHECTEGTVSLSVTPLATPVTPELKPPRCVNPRCVGCGPDNAHGLRLSFRTTEEGVSAIWSPTDQWESYPDTVHGGIVTTVLDEAMSKAVIGMGWQAFTVDLRVRFHRVVRPGRSYLAEARVIEKRKTKIVTEASLTSDGGVEHACAWATFLQVHGRQ